MGDVYGMSEVQKLIEYSQFDEFKNTVHAGAIHVNQKYPGRYGMGGSTPSFTYRNSLHLENKIKWVKLFTELGADLNVKANNGETPLSIAKSNHPKAVKWLKDNGAK